MIHNITIYKNNLCSLQVDEENRLVCLDSDGEFIDYWSLYDETMPAGDIILSVVNDIDGRSVQELCELFDNCFDSIAYWFLLDEMNIDKVYEEYGREFVNRIGNAVIIIKE